MIHRKYLQLSFLKEELPLLIIFLCTYYMFVGFSFGDGNNVEELPIIYFKAGFCEYPNDPFVTSNIQRFNVSTIYTFCLAQFAKLTGIQNFKFVYLFFHLISLSLVYLAIKTLVQLVASSRFPGYFILLGIFILILGEDYLQWMPNQRGLFARHLDPEFVVLPFLLWSIYFFVKERHWYATILLFGGSLIHPLYTLPIVGSFMLILFLQHLMNRQLKKTIFPLMLYVLSVFPYSILLWSYSAQEIVSEYNASFIHEYIRAPHHLTIPSLNSSNRLDYMRFFELTFFFSILTAIVFHYKNIWSIGSFLKNNSLLNRERFITQLFLVLICLISYLSLSSLIASFVRLDILVACTPYRMGTIVVALAFILLLGALSEYLNKHHKTINTRKLFILALVIIVTSVFIQKKYFKKQDNIDRINTVNWIRENTNTNELWLNYSNIDVRTNCNRSDYFQFKTIPLYEDAQIDWYKRLCTYYDIPQSIRFNYKAVRKHIKSDCEAIDIKNVITDMNPKKAAFILVDKKQKEKIISLPSTPIFKNTEYEIYDLIR